VNVTFDRFGRDGRVFSNRLFATVLLLMSLLSASLLVAPSSHAASVGVPVAAASGGQAVGWGADGSGQTSLPASLTGRTVTAVAAGAYHSLALTSDGQVTAWGLDENGQTDIPTALASKTITAIAAGAYHSLALTSDGQVIAWGRNEEGQSEAPAALAGKTVTSIAAGNYHSLALTSDGQVVAWGWDPYGQGSIPSALAGETVTAIAAGFAQSLAVTADGRVITWGSTAFGLTAVPSSLTGKRVTAVAAGAFHSLALTSDGQVTAWGDGSHGETTIPATLSGKTVTAIAAGLNLSVALTSDGRVVSWGSNDQQQAIVPPSLSGKTVTAIATGSYHSLAIVAALKADAAPVITGVPQVGETLTATLGGYNAAPTALDYAWKAGGGAVGTNAATYQPTASDVGKTITVTVTAHRAGHVNAVDESDATAKVAKASFATGPTATVTGDPIVGGTLTAANGTTTPTADSFSYAWSADGEAIRGASGATLALSATEVEKVITVTVTAQRSGYVDATSTSRPTGPVARATFTAGPAATIAGTAQVGQTLTAGTGVPVPDPESYRFAWFAEDAPIAGADAPTLTLTPSQRGQRISVTVTAVRAGYTDAVSRSEQTVPIVSDQAPGLTLTLSLPRAERPVVLTPDGERTVRRGRVVIVRWDATDAQRLTASGELADALTRRYRGAPIPASGSIQIRIARAGAHAFQLRAVNAIGTTTATTRIVAVGRPTRLTVEAPITARAGKKIMIRVTGLGRRERYFVTINGTRVRSGHANTSGKLTPRRITIPAELGRRHPGTIRVRVTGQSTERTGSTRIRLH
jgi:alpha-tubulin suppressor-like RCC1 family protein